MQRPIAALGWVLLGAWVAIVRTPWSPVPRPDRAVLAAFCLLAALLAVLPSRDVRARALDFFGGGNSRTFALVVATLAAALTWHMTKDALGDRGFSVDGALYVFQARALSHGHFGAALKTPFQYFGTRFTFEGPDGRLYGVFPPGWPLFLAGFVKLGLLRWQGPVLAFALSMGQWWFCRTVSDAAPSVDRRHDELATRAGLVATLFCLPRTVLTSDTMSHAFVAVLVLLALTLTIKLTSRALPAAGPRAAALGLCIGVAVGWSFAARLLDGAILGVSLGAVLLVGVMQGRVRKSAIAFAIVGALPFVAFLAASQQAATGDPFTPTQSEYFARSDWPPTCHRLGFGADVGCWVEHKDMRDVMPGGYFPHEARQVIASRGQQIAADVFGEALLAILPFVLVILRPSIVDASLAAFLILFSVTYGLFYWGNAPVYGARHLFPLVPIFVALSARALLLPRRASASLGALRMAVAGIVAATMLVTQARRWEVDWPRARNNFVAKLDPRRVIRDRHVDEGIVRTHDQIAAIQAYDPEVDPPRRIVVFDDYSGLSEIRRTFPDLDVLIMLPDHQIGHFAVRPPTPTQLLVELEREWPSFLRIENAGARVEKLKELAPSGDRVLRVFATLPGARIAMPFEVGVAGRFAVRVDGVAGPDHGNWALALDGRPIPGYRGYAPSEARVRGRASDPLWLAKGRHVLIAKLEGHDPLSRGELADFDALVGVPTP